MEYFVEKQHSIQQMKSKKGLYIMFFSDDELMFLAEITSDDFDEWVSHMEEDFRMQENSI